ncbi:MAG: hypothetical protein JO197_15395 [Acidobacteria bacterium]|nr:hypothetical protein [Acidobacteriota bacterium]MBV9475092.1 hypothetical protein [Acidobacteriota bacterium]
MLKGRQTTKRALGIGATSTIRTTTNTYKSIEPGAPGFVLFTSETSGSGATPIKRTFGYDDASSNPRPAYLESVSIGSDTIHTSEPSAMKKSVAATNDAITTTVEVDAYGQPKTVTSTGGTDAGGNASVSYKFRDATAPEYARAMPELVDASGLQTKFAYPGPDQIKVDEERGVSTLTNLDGWRRPVSSVTTGPSLSLEESSKYDLNGRLTETTHKQDGHSVTTSLAYDPLGRVKQSTTNNVAVGEGLTSVTTTTDYDLTNRKIVRMLPGGAVVTEELDGLGRIAKRTTTTGGTPIVEQYAYDLAGNLVYSADNHSASAVAYDVHGRATSSLAPNGVKTVTDFDDWGNPKSVKTYARSARSSASRAGELHGERPHDAAQTKVDATQTRAVRDAERAR